MTVKSTSIYLAWVGGFTVICAVIWEVLIRFMVVSKTPTNYFSVFDNPRAGILYGIMGLLFGSVMWATTTEPDTRRKQATGAWAKVRPYRYLILWAALATGFQLMIRHDPGGVSVMSVAGSIGIGGFFTMITWSFASMRADRGKSLATAEDRVAYARRLDGHIGNLMLKDKTQLHHLMETLQIVTRAVIDNKGWWPVQHQSYARGLVQGAIDGVAFAKSHGVVADYELLKLVIKATLAVAAAEMPPVAEEALAAVEHESMTR